MTFYYDHSQKSQKYILLRYFIVISSLLTLMSCASTSSSSSKLSGARRGDNNQPPASQDTENDYQVDDRSSGDMLSHRGVIMNSLSNNPLTPSAISRGQASDYANTLRDKEPTDEKSLLDGLVAARLGGADTLEVLNHARGLMNLRIKKTKKDLPELAKLEIGLAALQEKNIARARVFLEPLLASTKNPQIKASIFNAYGVASLQVSQTSSAATYFKKALKAAPRYTPALFNMGFLALKYGHYSEAQKHLSGLQENWYARTALITADRQNKRNTRVDSSCSRLVREKSNHKVVLFNCGLFYFENKGDPQKARDLIEKATQQSGGDPNWDEVAFQILERLP
ncbi:MAG: hypothetical protein OXC40_00070 [Proteobacteria bacterium]|nr:hypothetical protein [Pseudomonadota bacterium]